MALPKALVISDSVEFRETIDILLSDRFLVESVSPQAASAHEVEGVALVIADGATINRGSLPSGSAPILWVRGRPAHFDTGQSRRPQAVLPSQFDGYLLREAVQSLVSPPPAAAEMVAAVLRSPYLPADSAEIAQRAISTPLPLVISGEPGTGKARVARAIHAERRAAFLVSMSGDQANRMALAELPAHLRSGDEITLVLGDLADLQASGQRFLGDVLETGVLTAPDGRRLRTHIIATTSHDPTTLVSERQLSRSLFYQLNVLRLEIPPLRCRTQDIPALIAEVNAAICQALALPAVSFTEASVQRLSRYMWFGNLAELEAVLARSIAFATGPILDVKDLLFGYGQVVPRLTTPPASSKAAPMAGTTVDLIINELAHEFKNPMVTIKTFAQRLDHMSADGADAELAARLTGEAVERMDRALENLVQFTRFQRPTRQPTNLAGLISAALQPLEDCLVDKHIRVEVEPSTAEALVDPAQVGYALNNLLQSVIRDLSNGDSLKIRIPRSGLIAVEYPGSAQSAAQKLTAFLAAPKNGNEALPLGFAFAKCLIERNGGNLTVHHGAEPSQITIELPGAVERTQRDGESEDPNCR